MISFFLAWKDISHHKKIVMLVILLLAFSFINLTFFASFLAGLSTVFQADIINTQTGHVLLEPFKENQIYINDFASARKKIALLPGVLGVAGHLSVPAVIVSSYNQIGAGLTAIDPRDEKETTVIEQQMIIGDYLGAKDKYHIMLGKDIAGTEKLAGPVSAKFGAKQKGLHVRVGDIVEVTFQNKEKRKLIVGAIVGIDGPGSVARSAYITRELAEDVLSIGDVASTILVKIADKDRAEEFKQLILDQGIVGVQAKTWTESSGFAEALGRTFGIVIYITSALGILIATITVIIVIFINVNRQRRQIAVLKAIGTPDKIILQMFLIESILFGIIGVIFGIILTKLLLDYYSFNPINLPIGNLVPELKNSYLIWSSLAIMASCIVSGYFPARNAAKQKVLEYVRIT